MQQPVDAPVNPAPPMSPAAAGTASFAVNPGKSCVSSLCRASHQLELVEMFEKVLYVDVIRPDPEPVSG